MRNNFLLDYAAGAPLQLPPPPAYPPAPASGWGRLSGGEGDAAGGAAEGQQGQPQDVRALLATVAKDAIDVELSDEEDLLEIGLLPAAGAALARAPSAAAAAAAEAEQLGGGAEADGSEEEEEEEGEEEESCSSEEGEEAEEAEEEEEGQLVTGGTADAAVAPHPAFVATYVQQDEAPVGEPEDFIEFS